MKVCIGLNTVTTEKMSTQVGVFFSKILKIVKTNRGSVSVAIMNLNLTRLIIQLISVCSGLYTFGCQEGSL